MLQKAQALNTFWAYETNTVQKHRNRKSQNQYFTPEFAVGKGLSFIPKAKTENIIDPAVGNGVFLKVASSRILPHRITRMDEEAVLVAWGFLEDGRRELIGVSLGNQGSYEHTKEARAILAGINISKLESIAA